jgi:hypothetical protein
MTTTTTRDEISTVLQRLLKIPSLISVNDSSDILFLISVLSLDNKSFTSSQLSRLKVSLSAFPLSSFPSELCLARSYNPVRIGFVEDYR